MKSSEIGCSSDGSKITSSELFDMETLMEQAGGELNLAHHMLDLFLRDAPILLETAEDGLRSEDSRAISDSAHTLQGMLATVGCPQLSGIARELVTLARQNRFDRAEGVLGTLEAQLKALCSAVKQELGR